MEKGEEEATTLAQLLPSCDEHQLNSQDSYLEQLTGYDARLEQELHIVRSMRDAMSSLLKVLESAQNNLVILGDRMDQLRIASEHCRKEIQTKRSDDCHTSAQEAARHRQGTDNDDALLY